MIKKAVSVLMTGLLVFSAVLCLILTGKSALGQDPTLFGLRCFYLVSGSMEPTIPTGAAVIVRENDLGMYEEGDVITFRSAETAIYGMPNTHRIVEVVQNGSEQLYITKGDANSAADPAPVSPGQIYGKVIWNTGSVKWVGTLLGLLTTPMGFMAVIMMPLLGLTIVLLRDFTREYKKALESAAKETAQAEEDSEE